MLRRVRRPRRAPSAPRVGIVALLLALTLAGVTPMLVAPAAACAASSESAALVVDTGGRATRYCVALDESRISGIDLIELAAQQYGLDYRLGYGGAAVCRLDHVGIDGGECFTDSDEFWGYWRGTGARWSWSSTGGAGTVVEPGDVEGWSWGTGRDGSSHPAPPATSYESACGDSPPSPHPSGGGGGEGADAPADESGRGEGATLPHDGAGSGSQAQPSGGEAGGVEGPRPADHNADAPARDEARPSSPLPSAPSEASPGPQPVDATPLAAAPLDQTGPPVAALAFAGGAIVLLLVAGWLSLRRRPGG